MITSIRDNRTSSALVIAEGSSPVAIGRRVILMFVKLLLSLLTYHILLTLQLISNM